MNGSQRRFWTSFSAACHPIPAAQAPPSAPARPAFSKVPPMAPDDHPARESSAFSGRTDKPAPCHRDPAEHGKQTGNPDIQNRSTGGHSPSYRARHTLCSQLCGLQAFECPKIHGSGDRFSDGRLLHPRGDLLGLLVGKSLHFTGNSECLQMVRMLIFSIST